MNTHILKLEGGFTYCCLSWQESKDLGDTIVLLGNAKKSDCGICCDVARHIPESENYVTVERLHLVDICIRRRIDGKFLAVTNRKHDGWTLPGGKLDQNESPAKAAIRELREETGLKVEMGDLRGTGEHFDHIWRGIAIRCYSFCVDWSTVEGQEAIPQEEGTKVLWVERDELLCTETGCLAPSFYGWLMGKKGW